MGGPIGISCVSIFVSEMQANKRAFVSLLAQAKQAAASIRLRGGPRGGPSPSYSKNKILWDQLFCCEPAPGAKVEEMRFLEKARKTNSTAWPNNIDHAC